jgi:hypothetical protein
MCPVRMCETFWFYVRAAGHLRWLVAQELLVWPLQEFGVSGDGGPRLCSAQVLAGVGFEEVGVVVFSMVPAGVGVSAATESGLAGELGAGAAAVAPALFGPLPMAADADSVWFAEVCRSVAAQHLAVASQHVVGRGLFSGAQSLAVATTVATEVMRAAATAL